MKCPRDGKVLVFVDDGNHLRDRCPDCEGVLLDRAELAAALGKAQGRTVALAADKVAELPAGSLSCPRDGAMLRRLDHQGVELDLCSRCGSLWLDRGEIDKIRGQGGKKGAGKKAALAGAAAVAGASVAAAASANSNTLASTVGEVARDVAVEGGIEIVFQFAAEALGALLS
jgi:Zn-finger nucleic acid-binding protein